MRLVGAAAGGASQQALEVAEAAAPAVLVHAHRLLVAQAAVRKADRCDADGVSKPISISVSRLWPSHVQVKARRRGGSIST
jgi:hypothetical protein